MVTAEKDARNFLYKIQAKKNATEGAEMSVKNAFDRKNVLNLKILIGLDCSGSISAAQFTQFMRQIDKIRGLSVVKVIEIDDRIVAMYDYFRTSQGKVITIRGGGGTQFDEFFAAAEKMKPDAILFMTDGFVGDTVDNCSIPTGWILTDNGRRPYKFGEILFKLPSLSTSGIDEDNDVE